METERTRRRYDRIAWLYDAMEAPMEMMAFSDWRKELISGAAGKVLEVGVGTGKNLRWYLPGVELTAIDISPRMLARAEKKAKTLGIHVDFRLMDVERLDFPDGFFDCAVSTCVFCSVPDPLRGLSEIRRVLKEGGSALFLEHVRSENPVLGSLMDLVDPLTHSLIGPHINRRTVENIRKAGFDIVSIEEGGLKIMKKIRTRR